MAKSKDLRDVLLMFLRGIKESLKVNYEESEDKEEYHEANMIVLDTMIEILEMD